MSVRQRKVRKESDVVDAEQEAAVVMLKDNSERWKKWWTRFYSTVLMISSFGLLIYLGHLALIALVLLLQIGSFYEIVAIRATEYDAKKLKARKRRQQRKERQNEQDDDDEDEDDDDDEDDEDDIADDDDSVEDIVPVHKFLDFWFFITTLYYINAKTFFARFPVFFGLGGDGADGDAVHGWLSYLGTHHGFISFSFYMIGLVTFVLTLEKGKYRRQFKQLAWTMVSVMAVALAGSFHVVTIFEGLFWFLVPVMLVICNDIFAFVWGFHFGKTPLIKLSPRKTWEGFIGAFFSTIVFGFVACYLLAPWPFLVCAKTTLFGDDLAECVPNAVFVLANYELPSELSSLLSVVGISATSVSLYPIQLHSIALSTFASLIAPFGGFFASGFKRAFNIKDFADLIPGHGGITDRMDCQFIMGGFASVYYATFVATGPIHISTVLAMVYSLSSEQQVQLCETLRQVLLHKNLI
jgi:phosphatidate cytidylyltransferase